MKTIKQLLTDLTLASWTRSSDCNDIIQKIIESADKLTDQNSKLTEAFEILAAAHKIEISTNVILKKDAEKLESEIISLKKQVEELTKQNLELKVSSNEYLVKPLDNYLDEYELRVVRIVIKGEEKIYLYYPVKETRELIDSLKSEIASLWRYVGNGIVTEEITTLKKEISTLKTKIKDLEFRRSIALQDHQLYIKKFDEVYSLKNKIMGLENHIADLKGEKSVRDFLTRSVNEKDEMRSLRKKINDLENHNDDLIAKIDRLCGEAMSPFMSLPTFKVDSQTEPFETSTYTTSMDFEGIVYRGVKYIKWDDYQTLKTLDQNHHEKELNETKSRLAHWLEQLSAIERYKNKVLDENHSLRSALKKSKWWR